MIALYIAIGIGLGGTAVTLADALRARRRRRMQTLDEQINDLRLLWLGYHERGYDVVPMDDIAIGRPLLQETPWNTAMLANGGDHEAALHAVAEQWDVTPIRGAGGLVA